MSTTITYWASEDSNPGCDTCGLHDAVATVNGRNLCRCSLYNDPDYRRAHPPYAYIMDAEWVRADVAEDPWQDETDAEYIQGLDDATIVEALEDNITDFVCQATWGARDATIRDLLDQRDRTAAAAPHAAEAPS